MIGVSIICFDGTEHLDRVLSQLVQWADYIRIVENQLSRDCERKQPPEDALRVQEALIKYGPELGDRLTYVNVIDNRKATVYREIAGKEANQRAGEYAYWAALGAEWCLVQDADEVYNAQQVGQFLFSDYQIDFLDDFDAVYAPLYTYYNQVNYRIEQPDSYYVPFLVRPESAVNLWPVIPLPLNVDPTRAIKSDSIYKAKPEEIIMHHYSWVRDYPGGYRSKKLSSTARHNRKFEALRVEEIPLIVPGHKLKNWPQVVEV